MKKLFGIFLIQILMILGFTVSAQTTITVTNNTARPMNVSFSIVNTATCQGSGVDAWQGVVGTSGETQTITYDPTTQTIDEVVAYPTEWSYDDNLECLNAAALSNGVCGDGRNFCGCAANNFRWSITIYGNLISIGRCR